MTKNGLILLLIFLAAGCSRNVPVLKIHNSEHIVGLATPVLLQPDTTIINIGDYFPDASGVDSVMIDDLKVRLDDARLIRYAPGKDIQALNEMKLR
jgi:hypothetical protein